MRVYRLEELFNISAEDLPEAINTAPLEEVSPAHPIGILLSSHQYSKRKPRLHLMWATKLFEAGHNQEGCTFVQQAVSAAKDNENEAYIYSEALKLLRRHKLFGNIISVLETAYRNLPDDLRYRKQLAEQYWSRNRYSDAIDVLEPIIERSDITQQMINLLCNLYVRTRSREKFDRLKEKISEQIVRDTLDAELAFFERNTSKVMSLLQPYIERTKNLPDKILALYMCCFEDGHPVLSILASELHRDRLNLVMNNRNNLMIRRAREETNPAAPSPSELTVCPAR